MSYSERLPILFLALGTLLSIAYAVIVPPFQVPDENRHLWRAYGISDLHFIGPTWTKVPASFMGLYQRFPRFLEATPGRRNVRSDLVGFLRQSLNDKVTVEVENPRANLYSFVPYLTTALVLRIGRFVQGSPLELMYAGRLANAAVYLWLIYLALRILPEFRLLLLTIALTPMSLHLAASFSADSLTLGLTALFTAYVFRLAFDNRISTVRARDLPIMAALLVLLALCKLNIWTAILVALIPKEKFGSRTGAVLSVAACALAAIAAAISWQTLNGSAIAAYRMLDPMGAVAAPNALFVLRHPIRFCQIILLTSMWSFWNWCQEFIGAFGWSLTPMSSVHVMLYAAGILLAACIRSARVTIERWQKWLAALFVALTFLSIHTLLWVLETPVELLQHASDQFSPVLGIQGRYFLPLALPGLIAVKRRFELNGLLITGITALVVGINAFALGDIWLIY